VCVCVCVCVCVVRALSHLSEDNEIWFTHTRTKGIIVDTKTFTHTDTHSQTQAHPTHANLSGIIPDLRGAETYQHQQSQVRRHAHPKPRAWP
jgi:hypothetical protein